MINVVENMNPTITCSYGQHARPVGFGGHNVLFSCLTIALEDDAFCLIMFSQKKKKRNEILNIEQLKLLEEKRVANKLKCEFIKSQRSSRLNSCMGRADYVKVWIEYA